MGTIPQDALDGMIVMGELALDGAILPVSGALPAAVAAHSMGYGLICPNSSGGEAAWAGDELKIWAPDSLVQFVNHIKGTSALSRPSPVKAPDEISVPDFKEIKGQEVAKRAFEVAAAGGHHLLMIGPPGAGKSMLAQRMPSLLPPLDPREMLEISMVASIAGEIKDGQLSNRRPFRNPHHSASQAALVGGGLRAKPGEMALAHHGVLFLDELPEFQPKTLESLRQPLETGQTVIARANHHVTYPARFQLIAAMNPCRCGGREGESACRRGPKCAQDYQARISGPLLDRIDIQIELASVRASDLALPPPSEGSREIALRIARARQIQRERYNALGIKTHH
jgi:magnesium chelatase family protein